MNVQTPAIDEFRVLASQTGLNVQPEIRALTSAVAAGDTEAFSRFFRVEEILRKETSGEPSTAAAESSALPTSVT